MNKSRWMIPTLGLLLVSPLLFAAGPAMDADALPPRLAKIDTNQDGTLSAAEISAAEDARIAKLDANADGEVSAEEFSAQREARNQEHRQKMMARMDSNGDGVVSTDEMKEKGQQRMMKLDTDGDGAISADELRQHRMGKRGHRGEHRRHGWQDDAAPAGKDD